MGFNNNVLQQKESIEAGVDGLGMMGHPGMKL
ncbi:MAG: hypothetical protein CM1200mP13_11880 [Candidatus Pelagibacterales bacterium]|nr:MAG: hypothetical protein CM1200mP13_11880 [Pelagibacterales bacterium]